MLFEIIADRLCIDGEPVEYVPTAHVGGRIEPTLVVLHDTAGGPPGDSVGWLRQNPKQVSAHCIVKIDGRVVQLAPFDRRTNHAGPSEWQGRQGCNGFSVGIEIVNPGILRGTPDKATGIGRTYSGAIACPADEGHGAGLWLPYTEAQLATVEGMIEALARAYPTITSVAGHHHICIPKGRKVDPTPLMPWDRMFGALARARPSAQLAVADAATVRQAQTRLAALLYGPGAADGLMGPRTRGAVRTFQDLNGLPITGLLDDATLDRLHTPGAKEMTTGTRDDVTAATLAAAGSGTVKASNKAELATAATTAMATGNAVTDAAQALTEADKVVKTVETGRSLGTKAGDLLTWMMTPKGFVLTVSVVLSIAAWLFIRHIRARRVAAAQAGKQV